MAQTSIQIYSSHSLNLLIVHINPDTCSCRFASKLPVDILQIVILAILQIRARTGIDNKMHIISLILPRRIDAEDAAKASRHFIRPGTMRRTSPSLVHRLQRGKAFAGAVNVYKQCLLPYKCNTPPAQRSRAACVRDLQDYNVYEQFENYQYYECITNITRELRLGFECICIVFIQRINQLWALHSSNLFRFLIALFLYAHGFSSVQSKYNQNILVEDQGSIIKLFLTVYSIYIYGKLFSKHIICSKSYRINYSS